MFKKTSSAIFIAALTFGLTISASALSSGKVTATTLNVRSGPSTTQSIVTKVYKNNTVTILETKGDWYKIKLANGKLGWVSKAFVSTTNTSTQAPIITKTGIVTANTLNVRSGPSTTQKIVTKAYKNNIVTIVETKGDWYKVNLSNGHSGWVSKAYVSTDTATPTKKQTGIDYELSNEITNLIRRSYTNTRVYKHNKDAELDKVVEQWALGNLHIYYLDKEFEKYIPYEIDAPDGVSKYEVNLRFRFITRGLYETKLSKPEDIAGEIRIKHGIRRDYQRVYVYHNSETNTDTVYFISGVLEEVN